MDHRILFKTMKELGFPECYINTREQLYRGSGTYYMTPYSNIQTIPIHRGTIQGDTLSAFLFTIFTEPLLRWLAIGSRGYKPTHQSEQHAITYMTYDDHEYADDINITTGTLENIQIQIKKQHLFSKYTGLELETKSSEATGALWEYGNPLSKASTQMSNQNYKI
jgi:hypothetical protein